MRINKETRLRNEDVAQSGFLICCFINSMYDGAESVKVNENNFMRCAFHNIQMHFW